MVTIESEVVVKEDDYDDTKVKSEVPDNVPPLAS